MGRPLGFCVVGLSLLTLLTGCAPSASPTAPPRAALVAVARDASAGAVQITGVVRSLGAHDVALENAGRLLLLKADIGDRVQAGQVLAELDSEPFRLQASQAQAQLRLATAELDAARREATRLEGLVSAGAAARQDLDTARTTLQRAEAQRKVAADQAALSERAVGKALVRAPAAGVITARQGELGAMLAAGTTVFSLDAGGKREIIAPVSSHVAAHLQLGATVHFSSGDLRGQARFAGLSPRAAGVDAQTARFTITSGATAPGGAVEIRVAGDQASADALVPLSAVLSDRAGARRVLVVAPSGTTTSEPVQLLEVSSAGARVRGHLSAGQRVVAAGGDLITAGERIRPLPFTP